MSTRARSQSGRIEQIEFGDRQAANAARDRLPAGAIDGDRRTKTVVVDTSHPEVDEFVLNHVAGMAADSLRHQDEQYGQLELTDHEWNRIKQMHGSGVNYRHAAAVKARLREQGIDDWMSYYDPTLETDEHDFVVEEHRQFQMDRGPRSVAAGVPGSTTTLGGRRRSASSLAASRPPSEDSALSAIKPPTPPSRRMKRLPSS